MFIMFLSFVTFFIPTVGIPKKPFKLNKKPGRIIGSRHSSQAYTPPFCCLKNIGFACLESPLTYQYRYTVVELSFLFQPTEHTISVVVIIDMM